MRGLSSIHDVENSSKDIFEEKGFVSFLLCTPEDIGYIECLKRNWYFYNRASGNSLWVVVSFKNEVGELSEADNDAMVKNIEEFNVLYNDTPCLLFAENSNSDNQFIYKLEKDLEGAQAGREFLTIIDACREHAKTDRKGRTTHGFNGLKQELKATSNAHIVEVVGRVTGEVLLAVLKKIATGGIG